MTESETRAARGVVEAARAFLDGKIGVVEAARRIGTLRYDLDPHMKDQELLGFLAVDSESDRLVMGDALQNWHPDLREQKRREVADFENFYREDLLRHAAVLVERYSRVA